MQSAGGDNPNVFKIIVHKSFVFMDHPSQLACFQDHGEIRGRGEGALIHVFRRLAKPHPALKLYCPGGKPSGKLGSKDTGTGCAGAPFQAADIKQPHLRRYHEY
jgi:hypothetical protein